MTDTSRVRVSIVGIVVAALFCSLIARLWFLQLNENETAIVSVAHQTLKTVRTESPRGLIYDRNGLPLVANRVSWVIAADPQLRAMSRSARRSERAQVTAIVGRLSELLGVDAKSLKRNLDDVRRAPVEEAILAADVTPEARTIVAERADEFPHLLLEEIAVRQYLQGDAAVQVLGYVSRVYAKDLQAHKDYGLNDTIGRAGVEAAYEKSLRGVPASQSLRTDPVGNVVGEPINPVAGRPGHDVRLTIDAKLQAQAQRSLAEGIAIARSERNEDLRLGFYNYRATGGAVVVLDASNGDVLALASNPVYDPNDSIGGFTTKKLEEFARAGAHSPLISRATTGLYAPGSTFKLVTSAPSVTSGFRQAFTQIDDEGCYKPTHTLDKVEYCNAGNSRNGAVDLQQALTVSSDVYFYGVGDALWGFWKSGDIARGYAIQNHARAFGFGSKTHIAIDESAGRIPDAEWRKHFVDQQAALGIEPYKSNRAGYEGWNPGDNINLAVGQGDVLVTPLQLADAYAAFANGGTVWQPRLADVVLDHGKAIHTFPHTSRGKVVLPDMVRQQMLAGFRGAVSQESPRGTAFEAFSGFPLDRIPVVGKTGTAQVGLPPKVASRTQAGCIIQRGVGEFSVDKCVGNTSWFVGMFGGTDPNHPRYVVAVMVEEGGRGGRIAAPIARQIIEWQNHIAPLTPIPRLNTID